jgi:FkbM family methyltransferase
MRLKLLLFHLLLATYKLNRLPIFGKLWWKGRRFVASQTSGKVALTIHGESVTQPIAYSYPFTARLIHGFNNPLVECVHQAFRLRGAPIVLLDIGAAIGDTVLLVRSNCSGFVSQYYCIDGDEEFFAYLSENMKPYDDVCCIKALLSDSQEEVKDLVRIHGGTASAQGTSKSAATSLDAIVKTHGIAKVDVLKIDVDGFDGKVLSGATELIQRSKPVVIFEWHPKLYRAADNDFFRPFEFLQQHGYRSFVWYTKSGGFSHLTDLVSEKQLATLNDICLNNTFDDDLHYDVVSWNSDDNFSAFDFANLNFSRKRPSAY